MKWMEGVVHNANTMYIVSNIPALLVAGYINSVQNAMIIGAKACADDNMGFFEGFIDDVSIRQKTIDIFIVGKYIYIYIYIYSIIVHRKCTHRYTFVYILRRCY